MAHYLEFQLESIAVPRMTKRADHPRRPRDKDCEIYQTWQALMTPPLIPAAGEDGSTYLLRQGFSERGGMTGAMTVKKGDHVQAYNDPKVRFALPDLAEGGECSFEFWIQHWERDNKKNTRAIKALHSDAALAHLAGHARADEAIRAQRANDRAELQRIGRQILEGVPSNFVPESLAPWLRFVQGIEVLRLVRALVRLMKGKDDHWESESMQLLLRQRNGVLHWNSGFFETRSRGWVEGPGERTFTTTVIPRSGEAELECTYRVRVQS
ncbi:MAG: hypothetical protein RIT81_37285 [Deltaproteobacteria bacterium]